MSNQDLTARNEPAEGERNRMEELDTTEQRLRDTLGLIIPYTEEETALLHSEAV